MQPIELMSQEEEQSQTILVTGCFRSSREFICPAANCCPVKT